MADHSINEITDRCESLKILLSSITQFCKARMPAVKYLVVFAVGVGQIKAMSVRQSCSKKEKVFLCFLGSILQMKLAVFAHELQVRSSGLHGDYTV